jgi:hypothetical protein
VELGQLLVRDHEQLDRVFAFLLEPSVSVIDRENALDAARVSFAAHADAEAVVLTSALQHVAVKQDLAGLVAQILAEHRIQESILRRMDSGTRRDDWLCAAVRLRRSSRSHGEHEQSVIMRALRECVPVAEYQRLAGFYAAEKMRALGLMTTLGATRRVATRAHRRVTR